MTSAEESIEYRVRAWEDADSALWDQDERYETEAAAREQKQAWEKLGYERATVEEVSDRRDAHQEDECLLCAPAPHPNCEMYTTLQMVDPEKVPLPDDHEDHLVEIPVCAGHYEAFEQYQRGRNVAEVDPV